MQLKVLYWFIVTIKLCLCEHFAMVHPLAKSPSSLQFYSAPFQASAEHVTENASPIPNGFFSTVNKFDEGKDTSTSTPFLPHPVELESHHSGNMLQRYSHSLFMTITLSSATRSLYSTSSFK